MFKPRKIFWVAAALIMMLAVTTGILQAEQDEKAGSPVTWQALQAAEINLYIPSNWKPMPGAPEGQAMWYLGETNSPLAVFGVLKQESVDFFTNDMKKIDLKEPAMLGGLKAMAYVGDHKSGLHRGRFIEMETVLPDGQHRIFMAAALAKEWSKYEPVLKQIIGSIRFGQPAVKPAQPPAL
ncbi:MAG: hypothetical protein V1742_08155 [Pseudomonadota bacterium]